MCLGLQAMTDEEGRFVIADAPRDAFEISLYARGYKPLLDQAIAAERQEYSVGGVSGTLKWPVELLIEWCPDVLRAALQTQYNTLATTYSASLVRAATDAAGAERTVAFTALGWADLVEDTSARFGGRTYTGVLATLISEA